MNKKSTKAKRPVVARKVEPVVVRLSDSVTLIHGDCLECGPFKADAVITDPPYGMNWNTETTRFSGGNNPAQRSAGRNDRASVYGDNKPFDPSPWLDFRSVVMWGGNHFAARVPVGTTLVWIKRNDPAFGSFLSDAEIAWMKGGCGVYCRRDLSMNAETVTRAHPTQKPVGLMEWCMDKAKVPQGATVLDPYMGSGTTGIACIRTGRKFIGIEIDAGHFETARKRMEAELMQGTFDFSGGASAPTHNPRVDGAADEQAKKEQGT
jgi:DNA modification methylase